MAFAIDSSMDFPARGSFGGELVSGPDNDVRGRRLRSVSTPPGSPVALGQLDGDLVGRGGVFDRGPTLPMVVVMVVGVAMLVLILRLGVAGSLVSKGGDLVDPRGSAVASAAPGDLVWVADEGDSLWGIAVVVAGATPESEDIRSIVDQLRDVNGGVEIGVGQEIVVPAELLAGKSIPDGFLLADGAP